VFIASSGGGDEMPTTKATLNQTRKRENQAGADWDMSPTKLTDNGIHNTEEILEIVVAHGVDKQKREETNDKWDTIG